MKLTKNNESPIYKVFLLLCILIFIWVLFIPFNVGIADQGDFDRLMNTCGLSVLSSNASDPEFIRFYKYIVTDYAITKLSNPLSFLVISSAGIPIIIIRFFCQIFNSGIFKTQFLSILYFIMYLTAIYIIFKTSNIKNNLKLIFTAILAIFIFFDGNYLIWFNSLYGEPMMISSLLLFIASIYYYCYYKYTCKNNDKILYKIIFIIISAILFIGSKLQVTLCLPFILILIGKIIFDNRKILSKKGITLCVAISTLLIVYPAVLGVSSSAMGKDTKYNSVFYGILNGSKTPEKDLEDLGLNPDMASEAGKHSYLPTDEYSKYVPRTELTEKEFYSKIGNADLAKFYITHPLRLIQGMQYTAEHSFYTSTSLGKASRSYSEEPITEFKRFTGWSYIREHFLPKNLLFIISVFLVVIISSFVYYKNNSKLDDSYKIKSYLLWILILIAGLQFPMPYVGNGRADTAKQLFLFNFIFDIFIFLILQYLFNNVLLKVFKKKKS